MKVIQESEASRIVAAQRAHKARRRTWVWGALGVSYSMLVLTFHRPVTVGLVILALVAPAAYIFAGLWTEQRHLRSSALHHVRSLTTANRVLQAKLEMANREKCPDATCSRCRTVIVRRRTDFVMEQFGKLGPFGHGS